MAAVKIAVGLGPSQIPETVISDLSERAV